MLDESQRARTMIADIARGIDRRVVLEVRDLPGQERVQVTLSHGTRHSQIEVSLASVAAAAESPAARNDLRLRVKRAIDTMLFKPMPDHRIAVKPVAPPGGATTFRAPRGRGHR
jgi:hypothetical protein